MGGGERNLVKSRPPTIKRINTINITKPGGMKKTKNVGKGKREGRHRHAQGVPHRTHFRQRLNHLSSGATGRGKKLTAATRGQNGRGKGNFIYLKHNVAVPTQRQQKWNIEEGNGVEKRGGEKKKGQITNKKGVNGRETKKVPR